MPAGTFEAFKVEGQGYNLTSNNILTPTYWINPAIRRPLIYVNLVKQQRDGKLIEFDRRELVSFEQKA